MSHRTDTVARVAAEKAVAVVRTDSPDAMVELARALLAGGMGLFRAGHLQPAFALAGSLHHVALMARRRNARLTQIG